jgi:DNA polymerase (family 10)
MQVTLRSPDRQFTRSPDARSRDVLIAIMDNREIARLFERVADLLEIQGAKPFRIRAYRTASLTIVETTTPLEALVGAGDVRALQQLPGIGRDLAGKIVAIVRTGSLPLLAELSRETPESLLALMQIPGLGPKRAKLVHHALGVETIDQLEAAARAGRLAGIRGLGRSSEQAILRGIEQARQKSVRFRLVEAETLVRPLVEALARVAGVQRVEIAGSYRRRLETVGDVDLLVATDRVEPVVEAFTQHPSVATVQARGATRCSVILHRGLQVDLRIVPGASFGAALQYFTGSQAHGVAVRTLALKQGLKLNEYGVFRGDTMIAGADEADVYRAVGLPWIPPELREHRGEIDAALGNRLPRLVELGDIRGDLQMHTTSSDGRHTLEQMALTAQARGYEYIGITDHTQSLRIAGGMSADGFRRQFQAIDALQKQLSTLTILKSAEVDILEDGTLDLDDSTLAELDVVVISVHSRFQLPKDEQTRRIVRAIQHPAASILGHPTGRRINRREPYPVDMREIVAAARDCGVLLEINATPERLDLSDLHAAMAREAGVPLVISTDAHRMHELDWMRHGVDQARRAWCQPSDIANTRPLREFLGLLKRTRAR